MAVFCTITITAWPLKGGGARHGRANLGSMGRSTGTWCDTGPSEVSFQPLSDVDHGDLRAFLNACVGSMRDA